MLRRIRARRAARAADKKAGPPPVSYKRMGQPSIFRPKSGSNEQQQSSPPAIQPVLTMNLSDDEELSDTPSPSLSSCYSTAGSVSSTRSVSFAKAELLTEGLCLAHTKSMEKKEHEIRKLRTVMEELTELHEEVLAEKDEEIIATKIELGFFKEDLSKTECELEQARSVISTKNEELTACKQVMEDKDTELTQTKTALTDTKQTLNVVSSTLMANQNTLQEKEEQIAALEKSLNSGKRSATVLAGLLTLGALCSSDS